MMITADTAQRLWDEWFAENDHDSEKLRPLDYAKKILKAAELEDGLTIAYMSGLHAGKAIKEKNHD